MPNIKKRYFGTILLVANILVFNILHQPLESNFDQASFPAELRANMEKIRDLDEFVETEKARATSLREVSLTRNSLGT